jgi:GNAT superfamily N-acetyltransferase
MKRARVTFTHPKPGDIGWIIHRHGVLYAQEYGWNEQFEALVGQVASDFLRKHNPKRERCWIARLNGQIVGSVFIVQKSKTIAKLRLLYVEPAARGRGVGEALVGRCIAFARRAGYRKIVLWTNSILHAARRIYERAGFTLIDEEPVDLFGPALVAQTWELKFRSIRRAAR